MYLLDTNACIHLLNGTSEQVSRQLAHYSAADICISAIVRSELMFGVRNSQYVVDNLKLLQQFLKPFTSLPFDDACADQCGQIRSGLKRIGQPIGPNDVLIAATALAYDVILVTHNVREFTRVPGLLLEDWEV